MPNPMLPLSVVDVFCTGLDARFTGNQLAVVRHAAGLTTEQMQTIAREMNYAETTFILSDDLRDGGYDVRIFTVTREVPFAGHPTLGTAYVINHELRSEPASQLLLNYIVGQIPVTFSEDGLLWMRQNPPTFHAAPQPALIASALGLSPDDLDARFAPQLVSTGLPFLITPLRTLDAVRRVRLDNTVMQEIRAQLPELDGMLVFAPETYHADNQLNVRVLFDGTIGEPEDAATGSANGCLAAYLSSQCYFGTEQVDCRVEQGYEIQRPSLLLLRAQPGDTVPEVHVGGYVVPVVRGHLLL
jgi:trans-2,3-dihydro-3-hydroxyanthranilate isomerase